MKRLIWKELRERWLWALPLAASALLVPILGYEFGRGIGLGEESSPWRVPPMLITFIIGACAYSGELSVRADFLHSRPMSWKAVLISKLVVGVIVTLPAVVLGVLGFRFLCAPQYLKFAATGTLAVGAAETEFSMMVFYVYGMVCSVVLPGVFGSLLVSALIFAGMGVTSLALSRYQEVGSFWAGIGSIAGLIVAALVVIRFGLTLTPAARARRYALIAVAFAVLITVPGLALTYQLHLPTPADTVYKASTVSPDGRFAIEAQSRDINHRYTYKTALVRIRDGKRASLRSDLLSGVWTDSGAYYWGDVDWIGSVRMRANGAVEFQRVKMKGHGLYLLPSDDRKLGMIASHTNSSKDSPVMLEFIDLGRARRLELTVVEVQDYWWQSDTEIGYTDKKGARHIVKVRDTPKAGDKR